MPELSPLVKRKRSTLVISSSDSDDDNDFSNMQAKKWKSSLPSISSSDTNEIIGSKEVSMMKDRCLIQSRNVLVIWFIIYLDNHIINCLIMKSFRYTSGQTVCSADIVLYSFLV